MSGGTLLYGQAGTLSFSNQTNASNGLKRIAVVWNGYSLNQQVSNMTVNVSLQATDLLYIDRDAMAAQTLGLLNPALTISPSGYTAGGFTFAFTANNFNTSSYPGPQTLFIINYTGTPNCAAPTDTTVQISFGSLNRYSVGGTPININTASSQQITLSCNYVLGYINSPFGDVFCDNSVDGGVHGVDVNAYFRTLATTPANVTVASNYSVTANDGYYLLDQLPSGVYLKVKPSKLDGTSNGHDGYNNAACGLSTDDTKMMNGYILGIPTYINDFKFPWQLAAGDVNRNGTMTSYDISLVNAIIAGTIQGPWAFIPATTYGTFADPDGTFFGYTYSEELSFAPLSSNQSNQNYYGIKLGDVDGSCVDCPGFTGHQPQEDRAGRGFITIPLEDHSVQAGEEFVLPLRLEAPEPMEILAWQINIDPQKFDIQGMLPGSLPFLPEAAFNMPANQPGTIRFVWTNFSVTPLDAELRKGIFTLRLRAKCDLSSLQDAIAVSTLDNNASYGPSRTQYAPVVRWFVPPPVAGCLVTPMPFDQDFRLSFFVEQEGRAQLRILSSAGRLMYADHPFLSSGEQSLDLQNVAAWPAGVYMYELSQGRLHYTGRLIKNNKLA